MTGVSKAAASDEVAELVGDRERMLGEPLFSGGVAFDRVLVLGWGGGVRYGIWDGVDLDIRLSREGGLGK